MIVGMGIIACSFIYNLMISIIYFSKKRISIETKIYDILIILSIINMIIEFSLCVIVLTGQNLDSLFNLFLNRMFLITIFAWLTVFTIYIFSVSFSDNPNYFSKVVLPEKGKKLLKRVLAVFVIISFAFILLLKFYQFEDSLYSYTYGPAINALYVVIIIYNISWLICVFLTIQKDNYKKYLPVFSLILLFAIILILRSFIPGILLNSFCLAFSTAMMFHTIENPDIKILNELNLAKERAEKANNSKTEFLSSMSHEIRTPLNAIVGFSQVLLTKDLPAESKNDIEDIVMASDTLLGIVNGILDISKIEANKLEIINNEYRPKKIIDELIALTKARMGDKPLDFMTYFDPAMPEYLYGDSSRVKQVILNILTNSVKYTKKGYIDFRISVVIKDDICRLIISVEDSGIGIKEENINKLFKKFERLDEGGTSIEGTGLGLAITKKLVEMMGGKIFVQSIYGKGSKFTVALDQKIVNKIYKEEESNHTEVIQTLDFSDKKVLVVDDNTLNLKVAERLLTAYGMQVDIIESGFGLIEKIEAGEVYDLILLDDMMPKLSGTETLEKLRASPDFKIPTIALTANAIEGMREKYLSSGFDDYLAKPIDKKELNRVIIKYLYKK